METITVIVIISILAIFGITNYSANIERSHRRDAEKNLRLVHAAENIYFASHEEYWPPSGWGAGGGSTDINAINTNLQLSIIENEMIYDCDEVAAVNQFTCHAYRGSKASPKYTITVDQNILAETTNPSCSPSASCP